MSSDWKPICEICHSERELNSGILYSVRLCEHGSSVVSKVGTPMKDAVEREVWFVCDPDCKPFYGTGQPTSDWACRAFNFSEDLSRDEIEQGYTVRLFRMTPITKTGPPPLD